MTLKVLHLYNTYYSSWIKITFIKLRKSITDGFCLCEAAGFSMVPAQHGVRQCFPSRLTGHSSSKPKTKLPTLHEHTNIPPVSSQSFPPPAPSDSTPVKLNTSSKARSFFVCPNEILHCIQPSRTLNEGHFLFPFLCSWYSTTPRKKLSITISSSLWVLITNLCWNLSNNIYTIY